MITICVAKVEGTVRRMSILIKGLIMPSCCDGCTFSDWSNLHQTASCKLHDYDQCFADHSREYTDKRADFCPLVEIPEPHGRLIDASYKVDMPFYDDEYEEYSVRTVTVEELLMMADNEVPTVIEVEGSENHDD